MREQRWECQHALPFDDVLKLLDRLKAYGLHTVDPSRDSICYIEEFAVNHIEDINQLEAWPIEDVTLIHVLDDWQGDFFLLVGRYHSLYQKHQTLSTYCSISHPWLLPGHNATLLPQAMLWVGFRHTHSFIRVRLQTAEVVTPGETRASHQELIWIDERKQAFQTAIDLLELPIELRAEKGIVYLRIDKQEAPFFCSWADAFGPCQFEYNSSDPFEFLVPATKLAATYGQNPVTIRIYLTGFSPQTLLDFGAIEPFQRRVYRCSLHAPVDDLPTILSLLTGGGRLYSTLCEFQTARFLPSSPDAAVIIGIMGTQNEFKIEVRLNLMPLEPDHMSPWLEDLVGFPMTYAPLSPFP